MFQSHPVVLGVAIVCATFVLLGALGGIVYLAYAGKGTEAVGALLLGVLGLVLGQLQKIKHQTNGTTSRLLDAALPSTVPTGQSTTDPSSVDGPETVGTQGNRP